MYFGVKLFLFSLVYKSEKSTESCFMKIDDISVSPSAFKSLGDKYRRVRLSETLINLALQILLGLFISLVAHFSESTLSQFALPFILPLFWFRSFALMHEAVHGTLFLNKKLNHALGIFWGSLCFLPFDSWKSIHLAHHFWAGNIERDPTLKIIKDYPSLSNKKKSVLKFTWSRWIPLLSLLQHFVFWKYSGDKMTKLNSKSFVIWAVTRTSMALFAIGHLLLFSDALPSLFIGFVFYLFLVELINFPHHLELTYRDANLRLSPQEQHRVSRSCIYPKWISHYFFNNFNLHSEHHLFPQVPWYNLAAIHKEICVSNSLQLNLSIGSRWSLISRKKSLEEVLSAARLTDVRTTLKENATQAS